jgi:hypothetical protein
MEAFIVFAIIVGVAFYFRDKIKAKIKELKD